MSQKFVKYTPMNGQETQIAGHVIPASGQTFPDEIPEIEKLVDTFFKKEVVDQGAEKPMTKAERKALNREKNESQLQSGAPASTDTSATSGGSTSSSGSASTSGTEGSGQQDANKDTVNQEGSKSGS